MEDGKPTENTAGQKWITVICLLVLGFLGFAFIMEYLARTGPLTGPVALHGISDNVRKIAVAKEVWAVEHQKKGAVLLVEGDLSEYLSPLNREAIFGKTRSREIYRIMPLGRSPEAELTRQVDGKPKGTILRLGTSNIIEVIFPVSSK